MPKAIEAFSSLPEGMYFSDKESLSSFQIMGADLLVVKTQILVLMNQISVRAGSCVVECLPLG